MKQARTKNSFRNSIMNSSSYLFTIVCGFAVRTVFIKTLSSEYLGVNGLFTNILSLLSLAEMGIGTAIIYNLYKPLADRNSEKITQLMNFYKKTYYIIALFIAIVGLLLLPFIQNFIHDVPDIPENLSIIYLLYLLNSVASYLFIYKQSLLVADQQEYIASTIRIIYNLVLSTIQIIILLFTKQFMFYLIAQISINILHNIVISIICDKKYPFIKNDFKLPKGEQFSIVRNVKALIIYRIANLVTNSTDNLILSKFIGIKVVGLYSNYYLVIHSLYTLIRYTITALTASIGNLNTTKDIKKMRLVYNTTTFITAWLFGISAIGLFVALDDFIILWVGENYQFNHKITVVLIINFYLMGLSGIYNVLRSTYGLFTQGMLRPLISSIINLIASLILVNYLGILGVFLGTTIAFLSINIWYDPYIVYKHVFKSKILPFYFNNLSFSIVIVISALVSKWAISFIFLPNKLMHITVRSLVALIISNIIIILLFNKTSEFKYILSKFKQMIK